MDSKRPSSFFPVIACACLAFVVAGCAGTVKTAETQKPAVTETAAPPSSPAAPERPAGIHRISVSEDVDTVAVKITGDRLLTFTSVKQPSPPGVILYFPKTTFKNSETQHTVGIDPVENVLVSIPQDSELPLRIQIALTRDVPYDVLREDQALKVVFPKPVQKKETAAVPPAESAAPVERFAEMPAPTHLEDVKAVLIEKGVRVDVVSDGPITDYNAFTVDNPARIVFDIPQVKSPFKREIRVPVPMDSHQIQWVEQVRYYGYPDKVRVVLDVKKEYMNDYTAETVENGLHIRVGDAVLVAEKAAAAAETAAAEAPAWVNRIDFLSEDAGKSAVIVGTTRPVQHTLKKGPGNTLILTLHHTNLPDYRKQPLVTTRFDSAVNRIIPVQTKKMKDRSILTFELREPVPYRVEEAENEIRIHFEASTVPPKPLTVAELPEWEQVMEDAAKQAEREAAGEGQVKRYTGEKIALDFYETDIKNVFRILKEVSGKNFAIDNDVTGKVTLSFDKPVPWDQVMDLILKMNKLGKIEEGEIIRIARLDTIIAEQKKLEEKEDTRPLVTEYILVNYASAESDARPLIEPILSKRGKISVNARTNQIIITDVAERIDRAKEIVRQIDRVTPQVMIEARIVEAGIDFERSIGINWSLSGGPIFKKFLGGQYDYDFGFNYPGPDTNNFGFSFTKFLGSPLDLDFTLSAQEATGNVKILSAPKVATANNKEALISQGVEYPYLERDEAGLATVQFKNIDLELRVTPQITNDNRISVDVKIKKDDIDRLVATPTGDVPALSTHEAQTQLLVNDGDTIVIGGIIKNREARAETGFPWLSKIPFLGWLFKQRADSTTRDELIVFITPKIVRLESGVLQIHSTQFQ
ncbi:MAG: type IV pilus secretin PilQ [Deltaproteobacteria bacterium]|nr:type IV pilus secretin PilQ [Deltaproteobacteria bacterium]